MTSFFELYLYAKSSAADHPVLALPIILIAAGFLLPPLAIAGFLGSPILIPVALLLLVRARLLLF